jgi:hypothetical protein
MPFPACEPSGDDLRQHDDEHRIHDKGDAHAPIRAVGQRRSQDFHDREQGERIDDDVPERDFKIGGEE